MPFPAQLIKSHKDSQINFEVLAGLIFYGNGSPEGRIPAKVGATYHRLDGGAGTSFYVKQSGTGPTGWSAK
jgi:hypothetical protein